MHMGFYDKLKCLDKLSAMNKLRSGETMFKRQSFGR